jgi:membrane protein DedA with SNARE-associated domain
MVEWRFFFIKAVGFIVCVPLLGYAVLVAVELIQNAWRSNNRKKKWIAMTMIAGAYLALNGWFHH